MTAQRGARELLTSFTSEGLVQLGADGRVSAKVAERWQWENDGLTLRVFLRPKVKLHDGRTLTAELVANLLTDAIAKPGNRESFTSFDDIREIHADGDLQVVIDLYRPSALALEDLDVQLSMPPTVADHWQSENDGLRLRVFLRPKLAAKDGRLLTGPLAAELLKDAVAKPAARKKFASLEDVREIRGDGDLQLLIELSHPSEQVGDDIALQLSALSPSIGTGPYRLVKDDGNEMVLERFEDYYLGPARIEKVVVRPVETLRTAWSNLLRGTVDMVTDVPADALEFISNTNIQIASYPRRYQYLIAFNSKRPPFSSRAVRQALNAAIDRDAIVKSVLRGHGEVSTGPFWPQHWAYDAAAPAFRFDRAIATSLLDATGHRAGSARTDTGWQAARLRFTCLLPSNFSILERLALEVQRQLYEVGVDVTFESLPFATYNARVNAGDFDAALIDMISGPTLARPFIFWRSAETFKGFNIFGYESPESERLFQILRTTTNEAAIRSTARQLQHVFVEDPPAIFLAWNERTRGITRNLQVYQEPGRDPLLTLWRWNTVPNVQAASVQ